MSWLKGLGHRARAMLRPSAVEAELDTELREHFEREVARQLAEGFDANEARRLAALRFGNIETLKEAVRDERGDRWLSDFVNDVRVGWRGLRRTPGLTVAVTLSLAIGIGGTTAIFSVIHAVLMRPLPYAQAGDLYMTRVWWGTFSANLSAADYLRLRDASGGGIQIAAFTWPADGFTVQRPGGPQVIPGARITPEITSVLGIRPLAGRTLATDTTDAEALISEALWRREFAGASAALGQQIVIDGQPHAVVGIMPAGFNVPGQQNGQLWTSLRFAEPSRRGPFYLRLITRLQPPLTSQRAAARLTEVVTPAMVDRHGVKAADTWRYEMRPLKEVVVGDVTRTLMLFLAAAALVLLIAIANVTNLLLARGAARARELALRASLGARRSRLVRQLLAEGALYGAIGGALGLATAIAACAVLRTQALTIIPRFSEVRDDPVIVTFALVAGTGAGLVAAILPALRVPWARLSERMRETSAGAGEGASRGRARRVLVVCEMALTVTVLVGAGLLIKTLMRLETTSPGFDAGNVLTFRVSMADARVEGSEPTLAFIRDLEDRLRFAGITAVAFSSALPPDRLSYSNNYILEGHAPTAHGSNGIADAVDMTPEYFAALGIPIKAGRAFTVADNRAAPGVAIVNDAFVARHFAGKDAVGARMKLGGNADSQPWLTIVGVAGDVPYETGVWGGVQPTVYRPYAQNVSISSPFVVLKTSGDPGAAVANARQAVQTLAPTMPLRDVATMTERLQRSTAEPRFRSVLFSLLALLAVALATTGIYGVMAYQVAMRRRETAIRRALGARSGDVARLVLLAGLRLTVVGVALGIGASVLFTQTLSRLLFGVRPIDPHVTAAAAAIVTTVAFAACALPALRAIRVDAISLLHED